MPYRSAHRIGSFSASVGGYGKADEGMRKARSDNTNLAVAAKESISQFRLPPISRLEI